MKITRKNYEIYFLDYHEGNLSESLKKELFLFLEKNTDLKEGFKNFELISISASDKTYFEKERLKKETITLHNYKSFFVAYVEGDLNQQQKKETEIFIQHHPAFENELTVFKQAKLIPDDAIVYQNKEQLKRGGKVIFFTSPVYRVAIAASIALFILTYFLIRNSRKAEFVQQEFFKSESVQPALNLQKDSLVKIQNLNPATIQPGVEKKKTQNIEKRIHQPAPSFVNNQFKENQKKAVDPLLTHQNEKQQSNPLIDPVKTESLDSSENLITENHSIERQPFKPTTFELSTVFNDDELKELGASSNSSPNSKSNFWDLASKGAKKLSKVSGKDIAITKESNEFENTNSFALAIGNFSISHTTNK